MGYFLGSVWGRPQKPLFSSFLFATGKYGCREVWVCSAECGQQLGRDPSKKGELEIPCFEEFLWGGNTLGLIPGSFPNIVIFFSLTEAPLPDPTPTPETEPKQSRNGAKRTQSEPNGAEMNRNQALSSGTAGGACRDGGGLQGKKKITTLTLWGAPVLCTPSLPLSQS